MIRIPGWMACLAVFAMMAGSGVDAADATTASSGLAGTGMLLSPSPVRVVIDGAPLVMRASPESLPLTELVETMSASIVVATPPPPPPSPPPTWLCPIESPVRFADTYGEGRNGGWRHVGVDLTAPMGTPTVAPVSGSVRYSRDSAGGLSWHLDGDDGVYYYGTHLSKFGPVTGWVAAGTVIGYVGQSGNASLPHLHFEVHPGGLGKPAVNPTPLVATACNNTL
jgi:murein DD-endopeptidase MepM/ murein hydrolase activator NlpD